MKMMNLKFILTFCTLVGISFFVKAQNSNILGKWCAQDDNQEMCFEFFEDHTALVYSEENYIDGKVMNSDGESFIMEYTFDEEEENGKLMINIIDYITKEKLETLHFIVSKSSDSSLLFCFLEEEESTSDECIKFNQTNKL